MKYFLLISFLFWGSTVAFSQIGIDYTIPPTAEINDGRLSELSGIIPASGEGEYWGHNDSGNEPLVFRFNDRGEILQTVLLSGAEIDDWEAMTSDGEGNLYLADVGDNHNSRMEYVVYRFPEPQEGVSEIDEVTAYRFRYEGGESYDCESIFWMNGRLYVITKEFPPRYPLIFSIDDFSSDSTNEARKVGVIDSDYPLSFAQLITDAAYSPSLHRLAVLTYFGVAFYFVREEADLLSNHVRFTPTILGQSEALCFDGNDLIVTNETGAIWKKNLAYFYPNVAIDNWSLY